MRAVRSVEDHARETALQLVFDSMSVGVGIAVEGGALIEVNEALLALLGLEREQSLGRTLEELVGCAPVLSRDSDRRESSFLRPDGRRLWVRISARDITGRDGRVLLTINSVEDITDHKALEGALHDRALFDPVTGLPNRYLLTDRLEHALVQRARGGHDIAVLFVDLDGFKAVNDTAGHRIGDQVLREAGRRIAACARSGDTVARWAGDEFVVLCVGAGVTAGAQRIARKIAERCSAPFVVESFEFHLGASVGLANTDASGLEDAERLLERADQAMYVEKSARRTG